MNNSELIASIQNRVSVFAEAMKTSGQWFACAESCTGGMLSMYCTGIAGSSRWFERGFITYSNAAKQQMLGVDPELIQQHGAVSEAVARAMVTGVLKQAPVQVAAAVTGIAGPGGGSADKPVGTVCFGFYLPDPGAYAGPYSNSYSRSYSGPPPGFRVETCCFDGDREAVRLQSVQHVFSVLLEGLNHHQKKI